MNTKLVDGIYNGFIDSNKEANIDYIPTLLTNEPEEGMKVLCDVVKELNKCVEFKFSVAFLTMSGVQVLYNTLKRVQSKKVKGTIVVSQYNNFTEPKALRKLLEFDNVELRIVTNEEYQMHTKGYIFKYPTGEYSIIVGSSNLTQNALCNNKEWNVKLNTLSEGSYARIVLERFKEMYNISVPVTEEFIFKYEKVYKTIKNAVAVQDGIFSGSVKPNTMQQQALEELNLIRAKGKNKALAISSTGTGKTILSCLDVMQFNPKKMLFIVHRENICNAAKKAFQRVLGQNINASVFAGGHKDVSSQYIFAMIQTLSKDANLEMFDKDEFDYIIYDEAHRMGADSYQKVFNYFTPRFTLGMTATPERTDGYDLFKLFDYNIACEIRLNDAMKEDLICPFHYYGLSDLRINGELINDKTELNKLVSKKRVEHILNKIEEYGYSGNKVKGLIFVSKIEEAKELSRMFNEIGYNTIALSSEDSEVKREAAIRRLESDDPLDCLDYIFTRDIFNEGIDIPKVNQVVMLRPTESAIVFVQQLGRGLRKDPDKEYVVVLDFIGNYDNNFLIPIALSGDRSYNKDNLRRFIKEGNKSIHGSSTIEFEEVVETKIFEKLDKVNFNDARFIKESYTELKNKLGRIPSLIDFDEHGSIDVCRIFEKYGSYHKFLTSFEKSYQVVLSEEESLFLELVSTKYGNSKKVYEVELIKYLLEFEKFDDGYKKYVSSKYPDYQINELLMENLINQMTGKYWVGGEKKKYGDIVFMKDNTVSPLFKNLLQDDIFKNILKELLEYIIQRYKKNYSVHYKDTLLTLYAKYTYDDVLRALNFSKNEVSLNIGGYKYDDFTNTIPVFINYNKGTDIDDSIKYDDRFETRELLRWISKNRRTLASKDVKQIINSNKNKTKMYLFVRKNKDDSTAKEFYFLGRMFITDEYKEIKMESGHKAVEILYKLEEPVREELYDYLTDNQNI